MRSKISSFKTAGRPKAADVKEREQHILSVATDVFLEFGYDKARIAEIADRAQASKSSIYSRYATKEALFAAVMLAQVNEVEKTFTEVTRADLPLKQVLEEFGTNLHITVNDLRHRAILLAIVAQASKFPELAETFWESGPQHAINLLGVRLENDKEFAGEDPYLAAEMYCSLCLGMSSLHSLLKPSIQISEEEVEQRVKSYASRFMLMYRAGS